MKISTIYIFCSVLRILLEDTARKMEFTDPGNRNWNRGRIGGRKLEP